MDLCRHRLALFGNLYLRQIRITRRMATRRELKKQGVAMTVADEGCSRADRTKQVWRAKRWGICVGDKRSRAAVPLRSLADQLPMEPPAMPFSSDSRTS